MSYRNHKPKRQLEGRYIRLTEHMLNSPAWQALNGNARSIYIELSRRYRGPASNNGRLPYSVREAARALSIGRSTAQRSFDRLIELGFLKVARSSGFNVKGRTATEWLMTEFPDDRGGGRAAATKEFMSWAPERAFHSPTPDAQSPASNPQVAPRRDCVA